MDDVLTLGHTGRYRIDWIRRDDGRNNLNLPL